MSAAPEENRHLQTYSLPWKQLPWLCLDTETTGLEPSEGARIVEVGGSVMQAGVPGARFGSLYHPGCSIPPDATKIHGIDDAAVADKPALLDDCARLLALVSAAPVIVGYNLAFDLKFFIAELGDDWRAAVGSSIVLDPFQGVRSWRPYGERSLVKASSYYGIVIPEGGAHAASVDAVAAGMLLHHFAPSLPDFLDVGHVRLQ
jgi:DNA polymerase III epsilon subunit-like protein